MQHLIEHTGIHRFRFITESIPPAFARRMSRLLLERDMRVRWYSFAMVDRRFDRDLLALMAEAGCEGLVVGLETTNTRVLKLVHKSADREENIRFLHDARDVGIWLTINLIPDLPTTTYQEAMESLADIRELSDCFESVSVFPFEPTRSSSIGRDPEQFGLRSGRPTYQAGRAQYALNRLDTFDPAMTDEERIEVHREYRRFADEVRHRHAPVEPAQPGTATVRVPVEELDLLPTADGVVLTQLRTMKRITLSGETARTLGPYLDGSPFTLSELNGRTGRLDAHETARTLSAAGVLTPAQDRQDTGVTPGR